MILLCGTGQRNGPKLSKVPNVFGLNRAEREKINKYQDLKHDLKDTWNLEEVDFLLPLAW